MPDTEARLRELLARRILILDGALGTMIQRLRLSEDELRQHIISDAEAKSSLARTKEVKEAITHYEVVSEYALAAGASFVTK